jgi:regulator of PEP synthase PpsR (kinase-PPPase family)
MRTICFVSDRTGVTAETMGHSLLSQFEGLQFRSVTMPFVSSVEQAKGVVRRINTIAEEE